MKAFNKIGFFVSQGTSTRLVQSWLTALDEAGIPFFVTIADDVAALVAAQNIARQSPTAHTIVYRVTTDTGQLRHTLPDYRAAAAVAAAAHWSTYKSLLPPEWDAGLTWLETIRNVRPDAATADWLGAFAVAMGGLAIAEGFKWAAFGYETAVPEAHAWESAGMLAYLRLCADHPDRLGIALHEFSQKRDDIWFMRGDHVGRFRKLFAACDRHEIARPTVLITEWGWTDFRLLSNRKTLLTQLEEVAELYAQYPQVSGAALWRLGPGRRGLFGQTARFLPALKKWTLATTFEVAAAADPFAVPPMSESGSGMAAMGEPLEQPNGRFIADVTIPDDTKMSVGNPFTKIWRVKNTGNNQWGAGYKLVHIDGDPLTTQKSIPLPKTNPGKLTQILLELTAPDTPGTYFTDWRFQDDGGNLFGDVLFARIIAEPKPEVTTGTSNSRFVADVTIPDDTEIKGGQAFTKTWRVKNTGTRTWDNGYTLQFIGGTALTAVTTVDLPATGPNREVNISLELAAPATPGTYSGDWRMHDDQGRPFGEVVFLRIIVPSPVGHSLARPMSQNDPLWKDKRLGHAGSPKTIGQWGCLLTCFAMTANTLGEDTNPSQFNDAMISKGGFINGYFTKWNALTEVYSGIVYGGKFAGSQSSLQGIIDASLREGRPVTVQVDFTRDTPYSDNDQHWVLIVAKDGDDYRINDPWLYPAQEASLKQRYARNGQSARQAIMSAIFYRTAQQTTSPIDPVDPVAVTPRLLQTGINLNPDAPHSNPMGDDTLKGIDWVRYVFKLDGRIKPQERGNFDIAFGQYDEIVRRYSQLGTKSLIIINQETSWGIAPWTGNNNWQGYADQIAGAARRIAAQYRRYGADVAYQIWNEGDKRNNPASVYLEPDQMAKITKAVAAAIRQESPQSPIIFNGMATGPEDTVTYIKQVQQALGGPLPVDAVGIHPYTRWATKAPFDWGNQYGTLGQAFNVLKQGLPGLKFWITEIGVADDNEIGPQWYSEIGAYYKDVYQHVAERHVGLVPVVMWFAWSDWMRNAGIVDKNGNRKDHVYPAFRTVRNQELFA